MVEGPGPSGSQGHKEIENVCFKKLNPKMKKDVGCPVAEL